MKETSNYISFEILNDIDELINFTTNKTVQIKYHNQSRDEIREKLREVAEPFNYEFKKIISPRQTHTNVVVAVTEENIDSEFADVDGVVTNLEGVALTIATADCQSIFLYDKSKRVIGNIHSGWKGTLNKILRNAVNLMIDKYGCKGEDIIVCIGPSIMECCFEVDKDVVDMFTDNFDDIEEFIRLGEVKEGQQKYYIDTVGLNKRELIELGVLEENIYLSNICTKCQSDKYHSYRADGVSSGRNVSLICLK